MGVENEIFKLPACAYIIAFTKTVPSRAIITCDSPETNLVISSATSLHVARQSVKRSDWPW